MKIRPMYIILTVIALVVLAGIGVVYYFIENQPPLEVENVAWKEIRVDYENSLGGTLTLDGLSMHSARCTSGYTTEHTDANGGTLVVKIQQKLVTSHNCDNSFPYVIDIGDELSTHAIAFGNKEKIIWADSTVKGEFGDPIIFDAVLSNDPEWVAVLLASGVPVDMPNGANETPALVAALSDRWTICLYLLQHGANPHATNKVGSTIAWDASESRVDPDSVEGRALAQAIKLLKSKGVPVPGPTPTEMRAKMKK